MTVESLARGALVLFVLSGCGSSPPPETHATGERGACTSDAECGPGLACCYPCGVDGCENVCMHVEPGAGCPAIP